MSVVCEDDCDMFFLLLVAIWQLWTNLPILRICFQRCSCTTSFFAISTLRNICDCRSWGARRQQLEIEPRVMREIHGRFFFCVGTHFVHFFFHSALGLRYSMPFFLLHEDTPTALSALLGAAACSQPHFDELVEIRGIIGFCNHVINLGGVYSESDQKKRVPRSETESKWKNKLGKRYMY